MTLANRLRGDGIDAALDQYEPSPRGWIQWMKRQIREAGFIPVVCTETYCRRADGEEETGVGLGAIYESQIIQRLLYEAGFSCSASGTRTDCPLIRLPRFTR